MSHPVWLARKYLGYLVLPVADVGRTRDWSRDHLGLEGVWDTDSFALLVGDDGARLGLHGGEPLAEPGAVQLHSAVNDVVVAPRELDGDVDSDGGPTDTDWGYRVATCHDPAGHTVELFTAG